MPNETVERWKQNGSLYLWSYLENTQNFPGWHLSADDLFCQSFTELTEKMLAARWNSQKTFSVTPPSSLALNVPNNRGGKASWKSAQSLLLKHPKDKVAEDFFSLEEVEGNVILSVGTQKLKLLSDCVFGIPKGKGDYSIGSDNSRLWFWWS